MNDYKYTAAKDALTFLRAAQPTQGDFPDFDLTQAFHALKRYTERIEQAEREAETAKVREYRESDQRARGVNPDAFPWEALQPQERASWASRYYAARDFFEGES